MVETFIYVVNPEGGELEVRRCGLSRTGSIAQSKIIGAYIIPILFLMLILSLLNHYNILPDNSHS